MHHDVKSQNPGFFRLNYLNQCARCMMITDVYNYPLFEHKKEYLDFHQKL